MKFLDENLSKRNGCQLNNDKAHEGQGEVEMSNVYKNIHAQAPKIWSVQPQLEYLHVNLDVAPMSTQGPKFLFHGMSLVEEISLCTPLDGENLVFKGGGPLRKWGGR